MSAASGEAPTPWRVEPSGVLLSVRLTPRGGRDSIDGTGVMADGRAVLLARVRQVPEDGAANAALLRLIAKSVGIPPSAAEVVAGHTARLKTIRLSGNPDTITQALVQALAGRADRRQAKQ